MKTTLLIRNLPPELRARFKAACARRGHSMQAAVAELMRLYVVNANAGHVAECVNQSLAEPRTQK